MFIIQKQPKHHFIISHIIIIFANLDHGIKTTSKSCWTVHSHFYFSVHIFSINVICARKKKWLSKLTPESHLAFIHVLMMTMVVDVLYPLALHSVHCAILQWDDNGNFFFSFTSKTSIRHYQYIWCHSFRIE